MRQPQRPKGRSGERGQQREETYPLPQDTRVLAEIQASRCLNYGLRVERFLLRERRTWEMTKQAKERQDVRTFNQAELLLILNAYKARWEAMFNDFRQCGYRVNSFPMHSDSRVIVGLGAESVLEASVRLHRVYGFPIIPSSALKGLARSYALWQIADQLGVPSLPLYDILEREKSKKLTPIQKLEQYLDESDETCRNQLFNDLKNDEAIPSAAALHHLDLSGIEEKTEALRIAFGTTGSAGKVILFDAIPANPANLKFELDVMSPHYSDYYGGGKTPPSDYLNPIPVLFLTIAPGSEFLFAVASKDTGLASQAQKWLQAGLNDMGVGAKTVAGYGVWR